MKLRRLKIEGFRAIEELDLSFLDVFGNVRPVTVLAGPNGCGKTSSLFAIVDALRGSVGYSTDDVPLPSDMDIRVLGNRTTGGWHETPPQVRVELELEFDPVELDAIPKLVRDVDGVDVPGLPNGRLTVIWQYPPRRNPDGTQQPWWYLARMDPCAKDVFQWLRARTTAIRAWRQRKIPYSVLEKVGGLCLFRQDRDLRQRVLGEGSPSAPLPEELPGPEVAEEPPARRQEHPVYQILRYLSEYARGQREEPLPQERNWERRIQELFHKICAPKEYAGVLYRGEDPRGEPCFRDGSYTYPAEVAASGELVIVDYLTRLSYPSPLHHSLVLIDEVEVNLHPAWVRQLYLALPQMGEENQYVLTTHSPEMRALAAEDNALIELGQLEGVKS